MKQSMKTTNSVLINTRKENSKLVFQLAELTQNYDQLVKEKVSTLILFIVIMYNQYSISGRNYQKRTWSARSRSFNH